MIKYTLWNVHIWEILIYEVGEPLKLRTFLIIFSVSFISIFFLHMGYLILTPRYTPQVEALDLTSILEKENLSQSDYTILFEQTGLSQPIIDELRTSPDFKEKVIRFQTNYLKEVNVYTEYLPPLTLCEMVGDSKSNTNEKAFELAPYHNGYLFFTKSTFTMNWRHGHIGIVTDEIRGITLEALNPGSPSMEQPISKWEYYPTFKMMRLKDASLEELNTISEYANTYLKGLPYNILADKAQDPLTDTHCSLLIWQAFKHFGYDLDATGGLIVSPKDIARSPLLEVLQIYGFNPNKDW